LIAVRLRKRIEGSPAGKRRVARQFLDIPPIYGTIYGTITAADKLLERMRRNPQGDWRIEEFQSVARRYGVEWRSPGGSHVVFVTPKGRTLSVPARRPIKPVYVKAFVDMIEHMRSENE
jgi:hypothetical protein